MSLPPYSPPQSERAEEAKRVVMPLLECNLRKFTESNGRPLQSKKEEERSEATTDQEFKGPLLNGFVYESSKEEDDNDEAMAKHGVAWPNECIPADTRTPVG
jgi:hypothetical protein